MFTSFISCPMMVLSSIRCPVSIFAVEPRQTGVILPSVLGRAAHMHCCLAEVVKRSPVCMEVFARRTWPGELESSHP